MLGIITESSGVNRSVGHILDFRWVRLDFLFTKNFPLRKYTKIKRTIANGLYKLI